MILALVIASLALAPLASAHDLDSRLAIAGAIAGTDATAHESRLLMSIAWHESRLSMRVARCARGTTWGGRGTWQVMPRKASGYAASCGELSAQAALALERVRESVDVDGTLRTYACGTSRSANCTRLARARWVP